MQWHDCNQEPIVYLYVHMQTRSRTDCNGVVVVAVVVVAAILVVVVTILLVAIAAVGIRLHNQKSH